MQCVSFFFFSTADSPWIIQLTSALLNMGEKKEVKVWGKPTVRVTLDASITFTPQSSVSNHDARK